MRENECILDANAVLRFLLQDNEEQFQQVKTIIQRKNCYVTLEILAEKNDLPLARRSWRRSFFVFQTILAPHKYKILGMSGYKITMEQRAHFTWIK